MSLDSSLIRGLLEKVANSPLPVLDSASAAALRSKLTPQDAQKLYSTLARRVISESSNAFDLTKVLVAITPCLTAEARLHLLKSLSVLLKAGKFPSKDLYVLFSEVKLANLAEATALLTAVSKDLTKHKYVFLLEHIFTAFFSSTAVTIPLPSVGQFLTVAIPEVLVGFYEGSNEARVASTVSLRLLASFVSCHLDTSQTGAAADTEGRVLVRGFVGLLVAGLASESADFRFGAVAALAVALPVLEAALTPGDLAEIVRTLAALPLDTPQGVRVMVKFMRVAIKLDLSRSPVLLSHPITSTSTPTHTTPLELLGQLLGARVLESEAARGACRMNVRRLTTKMGKKLGWDRLGAVVGVHVSLVRYCQRMSEREQREAWKRRAEKQSRGDAGRKKAADDSSDSEAEEERLVASLHYRKPTTVAAGKFDVTKELEKNDRGRRGLGDLAKLREAREAGKNKRANKKAELDVKNGRSHDVLGVEVGGKKGDGQKKTQRLAPFAYVRLNPSLAKEKHKKVAVRAFKKVMGSGIHKRR